MAIGLHPTYQQTNQHLRSERIHLHSMCRSAANTVVGKSHCATEYSLNPSALLQSSHVPRHLTAGRHNLVSALQHKVLLMPVHLHSSTSQYSSRIACLHLTCTACRHAPAIAHPCCSTRWYCTCLQSTTLLSAPTSHRES